MHNKDRLKGMFIGLAVGDALGAPVEFKARGSFEPVTDYRDGGPFNLPAGYWTDDTSMALCSAYSLIEQQGFEPEDQMRRFLRWLREGYQSSTGRCFDIGNRTLSALKHFENSGEFFAGVESMDEAGNGALMRLAPMVIWAHGSADLGALAAEHSRLTHADPRCLDANRVFAQMLNVALNATDQAQIWTDPSVQTLLATLDFEISQVAAGSFLEKTVADISSSGYVVHSLEAALWAFSHSGSFSEGALMAANLGDDADTVAAIYGQLAGAFYGLSGIPEAWITGLHQHEKLLVVADKLSALNP
ncbi:MAG: ADP-ribosylglycohydrolase family protein [Pontibacterium sp.]